MGSEVPVAGCSHDGPRSLNVRERVAQEVVLLSQLCSSCQCLSRSLLSLSGLLGGLLWTLLVVFFLCFVSVSFRKFW